MRADLLVGDRTAELLDREHHEGVPSIEGALPRVDFSLRQGSGRGGRYWRWHVRHREFEGNPERLVLGDNRGRGPQRRKCGLHALGNVGRGGGLHESIELLEWRSEVEGKGFEPWNQVAFDEVEATAHQKALLVVGLVKVEIGDTKFNRQLGADVGLRLDLDDAGPSERTHAFAGNCQPDA